MKGHALEHTLVSLELEVVLAVDVGEAPLAGDDDLLATGELVTSAAESLVDDRSVVVLRANRQNDLADVNTGDSAVRLAPRATHTGLKTGRENEMKGRCGKMKRKRTDRHLRKTTSC